ncbi:MAG: Ku protein [Acidobacteria bacterium]|nr:MAG: Ku protein [Acidobacteriota bacterium]
MVARSMSTATISFGLVTVPIRLYAASESQAAVSFNLLHEKCHSRLKQQYICPKDEEIVTRDQMVKGYEFAKDQYVVFTEDEIKSMAEEASKTIEITEFVPLAKVDPIYFEGAYYLGPDKGGDKAYRLLSEAMRQTGRCALAKWAARGKQYLVLMRPIDNGLIMQVLHYADEVRPFSEIPVGDAVVKEPELKLAVQLIEQIATDEFRPQTYVDEVRARYHEAIQRKVEGQEVTAPATPEAPKGQVIDLMEALKASLAQKGPRAVPAATSAPATAERKPAKRATAARTAEARTLRAPKAAAGGKRR